MRYEDLSEDIQSQIPVSADIFNLCPEEAQQAFIANTIPSLVEQTSLDFTSWTRSEQRHERTFRGDDGKWHAYESVTITMEGEGLIITPATLISIDNYVDTIRESVRTNEPLLRPYMVVFSDGKRYLNLKPFHVAGEIRDKLEKYDDNEGFFVTSITICFTLEGSARIVRQFLRPGTGDGTCYSLDSGYWSFELFPTKTKCLVYAFSTWLYYRKGNLDALLQNPEVIKQSSLKGQMSYYELSTTHSHDQLIVFNVKELSSPNQTMDMCVFLDEGDHTSLVVHESFLSQNIINYLHKSYWQGGIYKIQPKSVRSYDSRIMTADIECYREKQEDNSYKHIPLMISHVSDENNRVQYVGENCLNQYINYIETLPDSPVIVWFHNGGNYDTHIFLETLLLRCDSQKHEPIEIFDNDGNFLQIKVHTPTKTIIFRDSCALIPGSLDKLAKDMGFSGKLPDIDIVNVTREDLLTNHLYRQYNFMDSIILWNVLNRYQKTCKQKFKTDPLCAVSASTYAKHIFFTRYYQDSLYVLTRHAHEFINKSYGGGRNEIFWRGHYKGCLYIYDFTSMYPAAGLLRLPVHKPQWIPNITTQDESTWLNNNPGFYQVDVLYTPTHILPIHGVVRDFRYLFPYMENSKDHYLFSVEILYGLSHGYKYRLKCGYRFDLAYVTKNYFQDLFDVKYAAKEKGHVAEEYAGKITANSAYGSFGFDKYNRLVTSVYGEHREAMLIAKEFSSRGKYTKIGKVFLTEERKNVLLEDVNVSIAAAITSYGRIRLHSLMTDIQKEGGRLFYCDTDSIITTLSPDYLVSWIGQNGGKGLGELKLEHIADEAVFVGCKTYGYRIGDTYICKSKGTKEIPNRETYDMLLRLLNTSLYRDVSSITTSRQRKIHSQDLYVYDKKIQKCLQGVYTKGKIQKDGTITPHLI